MATCSILGKLPTETQILIQEINIKIIFAIVARVEGKNIIYSGEREYSMSYIY